MLLITDATRPTSRELIRLCVGRGTAVRALVHGPFAWSGLPSAGVELLRIDADDGPAIDAAMAGVGEVFMTSTSANEPEELRARVVESALRAGVRQVVHVARAGGDRSRASTAARLRELGVAVAELRTPMTAQSLFALAPELEQGSFHAPLGVATVPLVDARDVAEVAAVCFGDPRASDAFHDLSGPESLGMGHVATLLSGYLAREVTYVAATPEAAWHAWTDAGIEEHVARELALEFRLAAAASGAQPTPTIEALLGRRARSLADVLTDQGEALSAQRRHQRHDRQRKHHAAKHPER